MSNLELGRKLLELMGVPTEMCISAEISISVDSVVTVAAVFYVDDFKVDEYDELQTILKSFVLTEIKEEGRNE